jgi:KaiC/GvpD/RAD55 family RecA-like ATPase
VAIQADLGSEIASARIEGEEQDLLQVLITRLRAIKSDGGANGWHQEIAHKVIDLKRHEQTQSALFDVSKFPEDLTADQMNALGRCLSQPVTYLWGPPGTGKTVTLAALALQLFKENKRVLVVSHTNHAVDGVVESLCRRIVDRGRNALPEGTILRVGTLVKESLIQRFGDQVHLESVMNHSHDKVSSRLDALKRELAQVRDRLFSVTRKITLLDSRDQLLRELDRIRKEVKGIDTGFVSAVKRVFQPESGGGGLDEQLTEESGESVALLQTHVMQLSAEIEGCDRQSLVDESVELSNRQVEMVEAIALLEKFMRDLRVSLLDRARIIATTATHAMLSERELRGFDAVLIDEASMLPLPLCFLLSGLAKERVVVAGDFRQLPAIATSDSHMVQQWYSRDVFDCAGVIDLVDAQGAHPALVTLTTQFRSSEVLCSLVNGRFYGGILETDAAVDADRYIFKEPLAYLNRYPVVLVDTSSLEPFGEVQFGSKSNLLHALLVRKIALLLSGSGAVVDRGAVGVISPYRRQANLIRDLLEECRLGDLISVGSVHKFQGSERDSIIFDLTESSPHSLGSFFSAVSLRDTGARLLNVALSRARRHLFVVANFEHLRNRLSSRHIMWHVLDDLCRIGYQLPVDELIGEAILTNSPQEVQSAPGILPFQCFDEQLFMPGLVTDLLEATNEVVFSSPTCTTQVTRVMKSILEQRVQNGLRVTVWIDGTRQISGETEAALRELRGVGVIVLRSRGPVPPVAVIDSEVAWLGSIAPLDAIAPAEGLMTRCVSDRAAYHALELLEPATPVAQEEQLLASA